MSSIQVGSSVNFNPLLSGQSVLSTAKFADISRRQGELEKETRQAQLVEGVMRGIVDVAGTIYGIAQDAENQKQALAFQEYQNAFQAQLQQDAFNGKNKPITDPNDPTKIIGFEMSDEAKQLREDYEAKLSEGSAWFPEVRDAYLGQSASFYGQAQVQHLGQIYAEAEKAREITTAQLATNAVNASRAAGNTDAINAFVDNDLAYKTPQERDAARALMTEDYGNRTWHDNLEDIVRIEGEGAALAELEASKDNYDEDIVAAGRQRIYDATKDNEQRAISELNEYDAAENQKPGGTAIDHIAAWGEQNRGFIADSHIDAAMEKAYLNKEIGATAETKRLWAPGRDSYSETLKLYEAVKGNVDGRYTGIPEQQKRDMDMLRQALAGMEPEVAAGSGRGGSGSGSGAPPLKTVAQITQWFRQEPGRSEGAVNYLLDIVAKGSPSEQKAAVSAIADIRLGEGVLNKDFMDYATGMLETAVVEKGNWKTINDAPAKVQGLIGQAKIDLVQQVVSYMEANKGGSSADLKAFCDGAYADYITEETGILLNAASDGWTVGWGESDASVWRRGYAAVRNVDDQVYTDIRTKKDAVTANFGPGLKKFQEVERGIVAKETGIPFESLMQEYIREPGSGDPSADSVYVDSATGYVFQIVQNDTTGGYSIFAGRAGEKKSKWMGWNTGIGLQYRTDAGMASAKDTKDYSKVKADEARRSDRKAE